MPTTSSAKKRLRQAEGRTLLNKEKRSAMRTHVKKLLEAIEAKDKPKAEATLKLAYQAIDKCARHHVIHANNAANKKARLARLVRAL